jgi:hypothetical protein
MVSVERVPPRRPARLLSGQEAECNVGGQRDQAEEIPAVQRRLAKALFLDGCAHRRIFGAQHPAGGTLTSIV